MNSLLTLQDKFTGMVAQLIVHLHSKGYQISFGEAYRPSVLCELYAKQGKGIKGSLHEHRLAIDLNLFKGGVFLRKTEEYKEAGEYWESIGGSWGGHFNDGNHFSLAYGGKK